MSGTVSFKVYMTREEDSSIKEVRRFGIEVDVVTNFLYLREKIQSIFPALRAKRFAISWKDSDGDDVSISSDEELGIALNETATHDIRKLYVVLYSDYARPPAESNKGPLHIGITCDGCDNQVYGYRYKCIQCPDYDLCMECEGRGMHPEHCTIRLSAPLQWKPHMGRRLVNRVNKFVKRAQSQRIADDEEKQCSHRSGKHNGKSRNGAEAPSWFDIFAAYLDEWANLPGECPVKEMANEAREASAATSVDAKSSRGNETRPSERMKLSKNVGESFFSQFLDPLINMQHTAGNTEIPASSSDDSSPPMDNEKGAAANVATGFKGVTATPKFPGEGKKLRDVGDAAVDEVSPCQERKQSTDRVSVESESGWTLVEKNCSSASSGAIPKQQVQSTAPLQVSSESIYPALPVQQVMQEQQRVSHPNPTIRKAVESMIQMGFSDNDGWLTNLLVSKGGDIALALDALSPARR